MWSILTETLLCGAWLYTKLVTLQGNRHNLAGLLKQITGPPLQSFSFCRSGVDLRICISNKFLGEADAAGPKTTLWVSLERKEINTYWGKAENNYLKLPWVKLDQLFIQFISFSAHSILDDQWNASQTFPEQRMNTSAQRVQFSRNKKFLW